MQKMIERLTSEAGAQADRIAALEAELADVTALKDLGEEMEAQHSKRACHNIVVAPYLLSCR